MTWQVLYFIGTSKFYPFNNSINIRGRPMATHQVCSATWIASYVPWDFCLWRYNAYEVEERDDLLSSGG